MTKVLLETVARKVRGQPGAAFNLPCRKISKEVAAIGAAVVIERIQKGPKLMPDNIVDKAALDLKNPFCDYGLDDFDNLKMDDFERTDFINAIKHLVALGYWWKLACSLPDSKEYKEKMNGKPV